MSDFKDYNITDTANDLLNEASLDDAFRKSSLNPVFDSINRESGSSTFTVQFIGDRSGAEILVADGIVSVHTGDALVENASHIIIDEQPPFAKPDYRTKRDATTSWTSLIEDENKVVDFQLTTERYVTGGEIIYKDAKEGDYISAEVYDTDSVIPEPYRTVLCEEHPSVAKYVVKKWLKPCTGYDSFTIDTYPLNAKISTGLYLRVTYHSSSETGTRKVAINYHLSQKLV